MFACSIAIISCAERAWCLCRPIMSDDGMEENDDAPELSLRRPLLKTPSQHYITASDD